MFGLCKYIFNLPDIPNYSHKLHIYKNWQSNNCLARSFLMLGLFKLEQNLIDDTIDAKALLEYLQTRHGGASSV